MTPQILAEQTKKHGVSFLLFCALFWMNNRLSAVETKLYDCLEDSIQSKSTPIHTNKQYKKEHIYAVLPKETKYDGKSKRQMES